MRITTEKATVNVRSSEASWKKIPGSGSLAIKLSTMFESNTEHYQKHTIPTVKYAAGGVSLWGCLSAAGPGTVWVDGKINAAQ